MGRLHPTLQRGLPLSPRVHKQPSSCPRSCWTADRLADTGPSNHILLELVALGDLTPALEPHRPSPSYTSAKGGSIPQRFTFALLLPHENTGVAQINTESSEWAVTQR